MKINIVVEVQDWVTYQGAPNGMLFTDDHKLGLKTDEGIVFCGSGERKFLTLLESIVLPVKIVSIKNIEDKPNEPANA